LTLSSRIRVADAGIARTLAIPASRTVFSMPE
jgi:hypothetical protein